jgi:hypothetical protein
MVGDTAEDTKLLRDMAEGAKEYISSFSWCPKIGAMYLGYGVGGVIAIFLVEFQEKIAETDDQLWVIVGDVPKAYMVVEADDSPRDALISYCSLMEDWINAVLTFGDFNDVFPVSAPRTMEHARMLRSRLDFLRSEIIETMEK